MKDFIEKLLDDIHNINPELALKRQTEYHQNYVNKVLNEQCDIPVVSGMLKHRSGVKGVFVKSFYPTGKPLTTVIETSKGYYCAPSNEFVDA